MRASDKTFELVLIQNEIAETLEYSSSTAKPLNQVYLIHTNNLTLQLHIFTKQVPAFLYIITPCLYSLTVTSAYIFNKLRI